MAGSFIERQVQSYVQGIFGDKAARIVKSVSRMAAKQGGASAAENYQLLGKRALIAFGAVVITAEVAISAVSFVISRRNEEQRIERVVRRVLEEERQKDEMKA